VVDYPLQVVSEKMVKKRDPRIKKLISTAPAGRWVVFEHSELLPERTSLVFTVGPKVCLFFLRSFVTFTDLFA